jgi:rod shape-determining protein MreD
MATLIAFPLLGFLVMLQSVVVSRLPLLHGTADIPLLAVIAWALHERVTTAWRWTFIAGLMVSMISALPFSTPFWGFLVVTALARVLRRRVWETPVLSMLLATFVGTLLMHGFSFVALQFQGVDFPWETTLNQITLPSLLLNLLLALPVYALINDLANQIYPDENQV